MAGKALASAADAVFLDLEDAVAPDEKPQARKKVVHALKEFDWRGRSRLYRGALLDGVLLPEAQRPRDLHVAATLLLQLELATGLEPGKIKLDAQRESARRRSNGPRGSWLPTKRRAPPERVLWPWMARNTLELARASGIL